MIGYHAMEGTPNGVLAHTYSPDAYRAIRVNGQRVGEIALDAAVAGDLGVPLIFVASDEEGCREASGAMPWIETVATKRGYGRNCALSRHPAVVEEDIYHAVQRAVGRRGEMKPFCFSRPMQMEIEFKKCLQAVKARIRRKGWSFSGILKVRTTLDSMLDWRC
jgi:D-amino peptidase